MDQSIACYRPFIRDCKWYWPLFLYTVEVSFYNSWLLYRSLEEICSFLDHIWNITMSYLQTYRYAKKSFHQHKQFSITTAFQKELRNALDLMGWIILLFLMRRSQDVHSGKTMKHKCTKCDIKLHDYCFIPFVSSIFAIPHFLELSKIDNRLF